MPWYRVGLDTKGTKLGIKIVQWGTNCPQALQHISGPLQLSILWLPAGCPLVNPDDLNDDPSTRETPVTLPTMLHHHLGQLSYF